MLWAPIIDHVLCFSVDSDGPFGGQTLTLKDVFAEVQNNFINAEAIIHF